MPSLGRGVADRLDVVHRMAERDGLERRARGACSRASVWNFSCSSALFDRAQAVRPLGMAERR